MKSKRLVNGKSSAQAMVEFAIALPILLMLLYGILEAGRLLFIYSTVVTASRQAVRYGSATGVGTGGVLRYRDCTGIRASAQRADFLNAFDDADIHIFHDNGPDPANPGGDGLDKEEYCFTSTPNTDFNPTNSSRLVIEIAGDFFPLVPRLVPFLERSASSASGPIMGVSARTILVSISIEVTAPPGTYAPSTATNTPTPSNTPTNTPSRTPTRTPSPTPVFTNTASLTPTRTLTATRTLTPTITRTPTLSPTPTICPSHGPITTTGNSMIMTINNTTGSAITIQDIFVVWNHDKGHATGTDKSLQLQAVTLGSQIWSGSTVGPNETINPSGTVTIPIGSSTLIFTFNQSYDNLDGTEQIYINLLASGCTFIQVP